MGTYDGNFYALDAATGDVIWQKSMPSAVHSSPTVMDGLVYIAVCSTWARRRNGRSSTVPTAPSHSTARTATPYGSNNAGKFANPVVAASKRVYLAGQGEPVRADGSPEGEAQVGASIRCRDAPALAQAEPAERPDQRTPVGALAARHHRQVADSPLRTP